MGFSVKKLVICLISASCLTIDAQLDVTQFGAVGDGRTDNSPAFLKAWEALCESSEGSPSLVVPNGDFLLSAVAFKGPCKSPSVHIQLDGTILAPKKQDWSKCATNWISFSFVDNLIVDGTGGFDGQGASWWGGSSYKTKVPGEYMEFISYQDCQKPTGILFRKCRNLQLSGIKSQNSIRNHFSISASDGTSISDLHIEAPENSPNTDGIDISSTQNVVIQNVFIATGDDCIAINGGVKNMTIDNVFCGPGHGISVGSLGKDGSTETVEDVTIQNCKFSNVQNGARIKTWEGGKGSVKGIRYINITLNTAGNPIFIDQHYCPENNCDPSTRSSLSISDVTFQNFQGTSATPAAIKLNCSSIGPGCMDVQLNNVNIVSANGDQVYAICNNVHGKATSTTPNVPCLN